jgi:hypothetical protein
MLTDVACIGDKPYSFKFDESSTVYEDGKPVPVLETTAIQELL